ncbi:MAG: hypothetical protein KF773_35380 [Deltaproteobacteria bacterium]|nr:hypothetical protein [Deltaproteobacteria bacterium]
MSLTAAACTTKTGDREAPIAPTPAVVDPKPAVVPSVVAAVEEKKVAAAVAAEAKKVEKPTIDHPIPATYAACMEQGKAAEGRGDRAYARELFEAAARLDEKKAPPHVELARSFIATEDRAKAIAAARKAVKLAPQSSQAHNTLGRAELLRHNHEAAVEAFTEATKLDGKNVWAFNNLGLTYLAMKKYEDAILALELATNLPGAEGYMFNNLGTAYEQLDRLDLARDAYEKGGKHGSAAAKWSRKRLEGVDSLANVNKPDRTVEEPPKKKEQVDEAAEKRGKLDVTPDRDAVEIKKDVEKNVETKPASPSTI